MAKDNDKAKVLAPTEGPTDVRDVQDFLDDPDFKAFRRQAALAILGAYVAKQGTLGNMQIEREIHSRQIWALADAFVATEHLPPLQLPSEPEPLATVPTARRRPAHPSDEFAVIDGQHVRRGFVSYEEAEYYASSRPGARIKQVGGGPEQMLVAAPGGEGSDS